MSTAATTTDKPTVLIVGAGLGDLMMGALLEMSNVPYAIFERSITLKPLSYNKLGPSGGQGAVTALHDGIALANLLYAMPTSISIKKKERYPTVMKSYNNSRFVAKVSDREVIGGIVLHLITHMSKWLWRLALAQTAKIRPQVGFLDNISLRGKINKSKRGFEVQH